MSDDIKEKTPTSCWPSDKDAGGHQSITAAVIEQGINNTEHCMVCGSVLEYLDQAQGVTCSYCGKVEAGHIRCPNGHYICEVCHNRDAMQIIEDIALTTESKDPFEIANLMISYPGLPMLGCQHAYIAGGAFMAAIKNEGSRPVGNEEIKEVFARTQKQAHGGYCGLSGVCGIAPAIGACFAILTGSKCGTDQAQRITMEAVTCVTRAITDLTGPSCCKAYVWSALAVAIDYLKEGLGIALPSGQSITCDFSTKHPHGCREKHCPYFQGNEQDKLGVIENESCACDFSQHTSLQGGKTMDDKIEFLLKRSLELGAENAKVIDTGSVVVEEWVRWKCLYGCAFCGKDAYHPPIAPDAESTKKVMKEYSKAILMTGSKGKALTETAVRLEGEAYHKGYYKAFAMTALSSGPEGATWPSGEAETPGESQGEGQKKMRIRPLMEACGIDVFKTARKNGFDIDTRRETYGRWNYFALLLVE